MPDILKAIGTYGNSGYNPCVGPESKTIDLSRWCGRSASSTRSGSKRAEAFNAVNWLRPLDPNTTLSSPTLGRILTSADPPIMQFALKYQF